jgi:hypothetical protein
MYQDPDASRLDTGCRAGAHFAALRMLGVSVYEIVLDGELAADFVDASLPFQRRNSQGATILSVPTLDPAALAVTLELLESLGIGVTAIRPVDDSGSGHGSTAPQ